jgi:hypothetical protein
MLGSEFKYAKKQTLFSLVISFPVGETGSKKYHPFTSCWRRLGASPDFPECVMDPDSIRDLKSMGVT